MTRSQLVALALVVSQAVVAYALTQPDVVIPPLGKFVLGVASVAISTTLAFLKISPPVATITVPGGAKPVAGDGA